MEGCGSTDGSKGTFMKIALVAASLVLVAGSATGCSSSASKKDFCSGYEDFIKALVDIDTDEKEYGKKLKAAAKDFEEVGVPDDISDDAKEGLEIVFDKIDELDDDASPEDISNLDSDLSKDDQKKADAFESYLEKTCPDAGASLG
jgi:hypothetical protein